MAPFFRLQPLPKDPVPFPNAVKKSPRFTNAVLLAGVTTVLTLTFLYHKHPSQHMEETYHHFLVHSIHEHGGDHR
jgi:hypothetical protein